MKLWDSCANPHCLSTVVLALILVWGGFAMFAAVGVPGGKKMKTDYFLPVVTVLLKDYCLKSEDVLNRKMNF